MMGAWGVHGRMVRSVPARSYRIRNRTIPPSSIGMAGRSGCGVGRGFGSFWSKKGHIGLNTPYIGFYIPFRVKNGVFWVKIEGGGCLRRTVYTQDGPFGL